MKSKKITPRMDFNKRINYSGSFDTEYDTFRACEHGSDCCKDDYCRCGEIRNIKVKVLDLQGLIGYFTEKQNLQDIDIYALDRIFVSQEMWKNDNWEGHSCGGYYGEEFDGVSIEFSSAKKIEELWDSYLKCQDSATKVEWILNNEYGIVPKKYQNLTWAAAEVMPEEIILGNEWHAKKCKNELYQEYPYFICLALKTPKGLEIIDGYHRYVANKDKETIKVLIGEKL